MKITMFAEVFDEAVKKKTLRKLLANPGNKEKDHFRRSSLCTRTLCSEGFYGFGTQ
jgi:hypothetical protein